MPSLGALPMMSNGAPKKAGSRSSNDRTSIIPDIVEPELLITRRLTKLSKPSKSSGSLAMFAAIRRALVAEKHDVDQRRGVVMNDISVSKH
jgi:hypothetical protein